VLEDEPSPCESLPEPSSCPAVSAERNLTFSLSGKAVLVLRPPFTRFCNSLDVDSLPGGVDLDIDSDPLPLKTTQSGRVVYDPDAAV
jgi:hypothetical protein